MKIAFSGASSTGKTTLALELLKLDLFKNYKLVTTDARALIAGFNKRNIQELNKDEFDSFQDSYYNKKVNSECNNDFITDRSFADAYCYRSMKSDSQHLEEKYKLQHHKYDLVIYFPNNLISFEDDGHRNVDMEFHYEYAKRLSSILSIWSKNVVKIKSDKLEERILFAVSSIRGLLI